MMNTLSYAGMVTLCIKTSIRQKLRHINAQALGQKSFHTYIIVPHCHYL